jgi:hypothetical protein
VNYFAELGWIDLLLPREWHLIATLPTGKGLGKRYTVPETQPFPASGTWALKKLLFSPNTLPSFPPAHSISNAT